MLCWHPGGEGSQVGSARGQYQVDSCRGPSTMHIMCARVHKNIGVRVTPFLFTFILYQLIIYFM